MTEKRFEDAIRELEDIVRRLESGDLPLEESIKIFEEGVALSRYCFAINSASLISNRDARS